VIFWIEQICRQIKGESLSSLGWPCSKLWSERIKKLMNAVADLKEALKADAVKKLEKDAEVAAKATAIAAKALKSAKGKETAASLEAAAGKTFAAIP
jgi:hypothetical protein